MIHHIIGIKLVAFIQAYYTASLVQDFRDDIQQFISGLVQRELVSHLVTYVQYYFVCSIFFPAVDVYLDYIAFLLQLVKDMNGCHCLSNSRLSMNEQVSSVPVLKQWFYAACNIMLLVLPVGYHLWYE